MTNSPELLAYLLSNLLVVLLGGGLTALSGAAYYRSDERAFATAAVGFALVTTGSVVEAVYELGIRRSFDLTGRELLALHAVEGVVVAAGLALLFYSIRRF